MKKITLLLFGILIFSPTAFAEKVRVYTDYSPVRIMHLVGEGAEFDLEAEKAGLKGSFKEIDSSEIPQDRSDREAWKFEKGKIKADKQLKDAMDDKIRKRESAITKLKQTGLDDEEINALGIGG